ncbi:hypothetical protein D9757_001695 [Collybiopsis confluens]|uniref:Protein N-terminal and lysine N-methyltransferase EFM7 n=1 Tax=Collybiopsis confluens TaxID=2823264 RepID=A0A8H5HYJ4_9AGAR|nr:hypothetical protein D9757_001695 [Collybiopsis confluens]
MPTDDADLGLAQIFTEASRPPSPEPTVATYSGLTKNFTIRLVGSHPLWGNHLWNSALALASYLEHHPQRYRDKNILELGAGGALPSLVAANSDARKVVITDYPDPDLMQNIEHNVKVNIDDSRIGRVAVQGYVWGRSTDPLLAFLDSSSRFDLIILSDLIFNHSQHDALLKTCSQSLSISSSAGDTKPSVLAFYTHHRPHLAFRDMEFFTKAKAQGWHCSEASKLPWKSFFSSLIWNGS